MLYSPALANTFEGDNAHFLRIADVEKSVCLSVVNQALVDLETQEKMTDSGASLVYAGYPYDPYA